MNVVSRTAAAGALAVAMACSGASTDLSADTPKPSADIEDPVVGAIDHGSDPAVVAIDSGGVTLCTGELVAPDLVLTSHHCLSLSSEETSCTAAGSSPPPLRQPAALGVRVTDGGDLSAPRVRARGI